MAQHEQFVAEQNSSENLKKSFYVMGLKVIGRYELQSENLKKSFYVTGLDVIGRYALQFALA